MNTREDKTKCKVFCHPSESISSKTNTSAGLFKIPLKLALAVSLKLETWLRFEKSKTVILTMLKKNQLQCIDQ